MYVIIGYVMLGLYSASITLRYLLLHAKYHKQKISLSLHDVINEIKYIMIHKEDNMDKGDYKNARSSEYIAEKVTEKVYESMSLPDHDEPMEPLKEVQPPTLTDILTYQPTDNDYEQVLDLLAELVQLTYKEFAFFLAKSSDETKAPNFMQIVSPYHENTELHKEIFRLGVKYNLDMKTLQEKFSERAAKGVVLELGDGVTIIADDGTGSLATAVQPIQSGIEGSEITFIFSFIKTENYEAWKKNAFPEPEAPEVNTDGK